MELLATEVLFRVAIIDLIREFPPLFLFSAPVCTAGRCVPMRAVGASQTPCSSSRPSTAFRRIARTWQPVWKANGSVHLIVLEPVAGRACQPTAPNRGRMDHPRGRRQLCGTSPPKTLQRPPLLTRFNHVAVDAFRAECSKVIGHVKAASTWSKRFRSRAAFETSSCLLTKWQAANSAISRPPSLKGFYMVPSKMGRSYPSLQLTSAWLLVRSYHIHQDSTSVASVAEIMHSRPHYRFCPDLHPPVPP